MDLRVDFNPAVFGDQLVRNRDTLVDRDALFHDGVVFHAGCLLVRSAWRLLCAVVLLGHAEHAVDLGDTQPVQDLRTS